MNNLSFANREGFKNTLCKSRLDIYLTGSNTYMLSGELATLLSGRYVKTEMLPLSFSEYVEARGQGKRLAENYQEYIETSSYPYTLHLSKDKRQIKEYLTGTSPGNIEYIRTVKRRDKVNKE